MPTITQEVFDITAPTYDADRARLIPCFDAFYRRTTDLIPAGATHILDLGAGTGLLSAFVRQWYPAAHIHLLDVSAPMLERARQRLANDTNVSYEVADYTAAPLGDPTGSGYDAIVSALSIHHLDGRLQKVPLHPHLRRPPPRRRLRQRRTGRRPHPHHRRPLQKALARTSPRSRRHPPTDRRLPLPPAGRPLRLRRRPTHLAPLHRLHRRRLLVQRQPLRRPRRNSSLTVQLLGKPRLQPWPSASPSSPELVPDRAASR